ncbi:MAG: rubrerythrin family protein [Mycoplasmataceae bacterium]|nr:rubrerythrin family protein [Mycoplasmataceae bacterium]
MNKKTDINKKLNEIDKKSKTYKNLQTAFAGEAQARVRYQFFASQAKKEGYIHISNIFTQTSDNEKEHAEIWFKLLYNHSIPPTTKDLLISINNEKYEWDTMYKEFAKDALNEGYESIANLFENVGEIEKSHQQRFESLLKQIEEDTIFKSTKEVYWWCTNCGTLIKGKKPPLLCPVCSHPQGYFVQKDIKISE